jgi:CubicO group peptidase (beta-lactamase class C family)
LFKKLLVSVVLLLGFGEVDRLAINEREFAIYDRRADSASDGGKHFDPESLHEIFLRRSEGADRLTSEIDQGAIRMAIWRAHRAGLLLWLLFVTAMGGVQTKAAEDKKTAAVDEIFADLTRTGSPGCAVGVYRDGKIIYSRGYGLANLEQSVPITPQSVFDIGSTSKQFTAASILLLEKHGKLRLDDDIRKYIPELSDYGQKITILHLLNHTSGLRDYLTLMDLAGVNTDSVTTDEDALQIIARQKALNFPPGSDMLYSNTGFFLLSTVVKRVSGKTLREFAAENIFAPLAMVHTVFRDDHTGLVANRSMAYEPDEKRGGYSLAVSYFEQTGDGAVHTSVEDLLKWDENFYSAQVGGKELLAELQEPGKLNSGKVLDYAKGLHIGEYRGLRTVSHGGAWGGYRAELLRFPEQHFSVACLCNLGIAAPWKRSQQVAEVYLGGLMQPRKEKKKESEDVGKPKPEIRISPEQLGYSGTYYSDELRVAYVLYVKEGKLRVAMEQTSGAFSNLPNHEPSYLRATGPDEFEIAETGTTLHFHRDAGHLVTGFTLDAGRTKGLSFARSLSGLKPGAN